MIHHLAGLAEPATLQASLVIDIRTLELSRIPVEPAAGLPGLLGRGRRARIIPGMRLGVRAALVGGAELTGDVEVEDGRIVAVGRSPAGAAGLAVPGFVDLQVNGFAGVDFLAAAPEDYAVAGEALAAAGVTAYQPTLITSAPGALRAALAVVAGRRRALPDPRARRAPRGAVPLAQLARSAPARAPARPRPGPARRAARGGTCRSSHARP